MHSDALEKTDYVGTIGRVRFKDKHTPNPQALEVGPEAITGLMFQWQQGKQINLWPPNLGGHSATISAAHRYSLVGLSRRLIRDGGGRLLSPQCERPGHYCAWS